MHEGKLDPRLRFLQEQTADERIGFAESVRLGRVSTARRVVGIDVLLRCRKGPGTKTVRSIERKLTARGVEVRSSVDGPVVVVSGRVPVNRCEDLLQEDWIELIEASKQLFPDLDLSGRDVGARTLQTIAPTVRGTNVLVGIVDSGIDYRHDDFRLPDGSSRIRFLWDQSAPSVAGGRVPFGREFTKAHLDAALRTNPAPVPVNHNDGDGHGTHVAGIAAGNGRRSSGQFVGMAPDSELVIVAVRSDAGTLGESTSATIAFSYIVDRARELNRPVSINMSLGNNGGGHSGEMPLETAMDNLARLPGVVIVKSAGNEQPWRIHASGTVTQGIAPVRRQFESSGSNTQQDVFEIWFDAADRISIAVQAPGGPTPVGNDFVAPGSVNTFETNANNSVRIDASSVDAGGTGDVRAIVFIGRGTAPRIQPGRWSLHFRGDQITVGRFDVWIERTSRADGGAEQTRFTSADNDPTCTISIPGTARRIITVGSYVTRFANDAPLGSLSRFSGRGPTRYGLRKPELSAPGESIVSVRSSGANRPAFAPGYTLMPGTSMAAPHVTGIAALLLEINPQFTCEQVKQILSRAARRNGAAAVAPDDTWGSGRLTALRATELARTVRFPIISNVVINGTTLSWDTDIPTTGAVRFNSHQRRMFLGRATGSRVSLTLGLHHTINLEGLPPATYHCEILAFTPAPEEWQTLDDRQGQHYAITVP